MIGSLLNRGLLLIFGYAYPAYECFKSLEMNKPDIEELRFWCQYWVLVAALTVCERITDIFIGWLPMYGETKLAFLIYLWFSKTKGTTFVYDSYFRPYLAKHEAEIDRNLLELRTRTGDTALLWLQKAVIYGQTGIVEVLQYVASQSFLPLRAQPSQQGTGIQKLAVTLIQGSVVTTQPLALSDHKEDAADKAGPPEDIKPAATSINGPVATAQPQDRQPPSPPSSDHQEDATDKAGLLEDLKPAPAPAASGNQNTAPAPAPAQALTGTVEMLDGLVVKHVDAVPSTENGIDQPQ